MTVGSHLSTDVVSDLLEGLLSEPDRVAAEAHLASCAACTEVAEGLVRVRDVLRSAPPPPMPADVAERLTAALAVEAAARAEETGVVSLGHARQRKLSRRAAQLLLAAASVAVLAVAGGLVANEINDRNTAAQIEQSTGAPSPGRSAAASELYLARDRPAELTSAGFVAQAAELLTTTTPPKPKPGDGPHMVTNPASCVNQAVGGEVRDFRRVEFDGQDAYLAITNRPGTDVIEAFVIIGCPGQGRVTKQAELPH